MTCIVGMIDKENRELYIGGDRLGSNGHSKVSVANPKVFKKGEALFGYTTSFRFGQIIEMYLEMPKDDRETPYEYIVKDLLPEIRKILEEHKYSNDDNTGKCGNMIIMYRGCFELETDWAVLESEKFVGVGSGGIAASSALFALNSVSSGTSYQEQIEIALKSATNIITSVDGPYDILSVKY